MVGARLVKRDGLVRRGSAAILGEHSMLTCYPEGVRHTKALLNLHDLACCHHLIDQRHEFGLLDDLGQADSMLDLPPVVEQMCQLGQRQRTCVEKLSFQNLNRGIPEPIPVLVGNLFQLLLRQRHSRVELVWHVRGNDLAAAERGLITPRQIC
jgi:hypothetical protein